jgi:phospho-N-acetylmuramoyl-pentapeptide-transferase
MLYYFFKYLDAEYDLAGAGLFQYITFRAGVAGLMALFIGLVVGKKIINYLQYKQIGEVTRTDGPESHFSKAGTPTMGGIIIIIAIVVPTLLFAQIMNVYVILLLVSTLWMGAMGFLDDYIKVFKKDKKGLREKFKLVGQIGLGIIIGTVLYVHPLIKHVALETNVLLLKSQVFDYNFLELSRDWAWVVFIPVIVFVVTAVTNGVNLTDGIDGLAAGTTAYVGAGLIVLAYMAGNVILADYLNIIYVPYSGEVVVFLAAMVGACIGFLWYNAYPAQVFMGDTGSLALGGAVVASAIIIKMELLIPILCLVYFVESLSVVLQVSYFKYTKKKYGEGRRIFLMSPLHHHYEKKGIPEPKIVTRFWIVTIITVIIAIIMLKVR